MLKSRRTYRDKEEVQEINDELDLKTLNSFLIRRQSKRSTINTIQNETEKNSQTFEKSQSASELFKPKKYDSESKK